MTYLTALVRNRTVQQLVLFTICQNLLWWLAGATTSTGHALTWIVKLCLVGYGALLDAGYFLILRHRFSSSLGPLLVVGAATFGILAAPNNHLVQLFALLLCIFLVLTTIPQLGLQSGYGLVVFSCLAGVGVPVILFFLRNHYLSSQFLLTLVPIVASYFAFFAAYYFPEPHDWRLTLIAPIGFALVTLILAFSWQSLIAIVLTGIHWWLQRHLKGPYRLVLSGSLQLIVGYLIIQ